MERHYGAHAAIAASAEQLPRADNRRSLDPQQRDVYELPKARVTMTLDARDLHTLRSMLARCRALAAAKARWGIRWVLLPPSPSLETRP